jgi:hypothetical protein
MPLITLTPDQLDAVYGVLDGWKLGLTEGTISGSTWTVDTIDALKSRVQDGNVDRDDLQQLGFFTADAAKDLRTDYGIHDPAYQTMDGVSAAFFAHYHQLNPNR